MLTSRITPIRFDVIIGMDYAMHRPNKGVKHKVRILFGFLWRAANAGGICVRRGNNAGMRGSVAGAAPCSRGGETALRSYRQRDGHPGGTEEMRKSVSAMLFVARRGTNGIAVLLSHDRTSVRSGVQPMKNQCLNHPFGVGETLRTILFKGLK